MLFLFQGFYFTLSCINLVQLRNLVSLLKFLLGTEQRKSPLQRAMYEYLRGKMLDVFPEYRKEVEDHLSKAVSILNHKDFVVCMILFGIII